MGNKWDDMRNAYKEAAAQIRAADAITIDILSMIKGRLRTVPYYNRDLLISLKRELRDFNSHTKRWKP